MTNELKRKYRPKFQWPLKLKNYGDDSHKILPTKSKGGKNKMKKQIHSTQQEIIDLQQVIKAQDAIIQELEKRK